MTLSLVTSPRTDLIEAVAAAVPGARTVLVHHEDGVMTAMTVEVDPMWFDDANIRYVLPGGELAAALARLGWTEADGEHGLVWDDVDRVGVSAAATHEGARALLRCGQDLLDDLPACPPGWVEVPVA